MWCGMQDNGEFAASHNIAAKNHGKNDDNSDDSKHERLFHH
jgi:hypothetical protein